MIMIDNNLIKLSYVLERHGYNGGSMATVDKGIPSRFLLLHTIYYEKL